MLATRSDVGSLSSQRSDVGSLSSQRSDVGSLSSHIKPFPRCRQVKHTTKSALVGPELHINHRE
jgi:hypothetical protein